VPDREVAVALDWSQYTPAIGSAIVRTLEFTVIGFAGAVIVGLVIAVLRMSPLGPVRVVARLYTEIFRNLPLITEVFVIYFGLASVGLRFSALVAGSLSLALFYGAYLSEMFRGGIAGVPHDQQEAGQAVGLTSWTIFWHITVPQAARVALPGTSTMLVDLLKGTSIMVTIGGAELMTQGQVIAGETFQALQVYLVIGAIYVAMAWPLSQLALVLEARLNRSTPLLPGRRRLWRMTRALGARTG
jgi:His/Glu/Gln/Arg/opine family amino acid ABC transporter permease subunit